MRIKFIFKPTVEPVKLGYFNPDHFKSWTLTINVKRKSLLIYVWNFPEYFVKYKVSGLNFNEKKCINLGPKLTCILLIKIV